MTRRVELILLGFARAPSRESSLNALPHLLWCDNLLECVALFYNANGRSGFIKAVNLQLGLRFPITLFNCCLQNPQLFYFNFDLSSGKITR